MLFSKHAEQRGSIEWIFLVGAMEKVDAHHTFGRLKYSKDTENKGIQQTEFWILADPTFKISYLDYCLYDLVVMFERASSGLGVWIWLESERILLGFGSGQEDCIELVWNSWKHAQKARLWCLPT